MIINEIDLFKGIDAEVMNAIASASTEEVYKKDTVLFEKGAEANCLYILEEGSINLVIKNGGTISYSLTRSGEVFGWSCMVEAGRYTAAGICATDTKAVKIEREQLDRIFNQYPEVGFTVLKRLAGVISRRLSNAYQDLLMTRKTDTTPSYG